MGYSPPVGSALLSHLSGISVTASTAQAYYTIGPAISIPKLGKIKVTVIGYVSAGTGYIMINLIRNSTTYQIGSFIYSLFVTASNSNTFGNTSAELLIKNVSQSNALGATTNADESDFAFELPVIPGDTIQFYTGNNIANDITYITDLVVILE